MGKLIKMVINFFYFFINCIYKIMKIIFFVILIKYIYFFLFEKGIEFFFGSLKYIIMNYLVWY